MWADGSSADSIREAIGQVDPDLMKAHLFHLSKQPIPFRKLNFTLDGHAQNTLYEADEFLAGQLTQYGFRVEREGVRVQAFRRDRTKPLSAQYSPPQAEDPWLTAFNLYAEKKGVSRPEEIILLLAHKDSQSWIDSPGANDNAIGTVGVLEIARILADCPLNRTVRFLWCNEEHWPWTSVTAARNAKSRGDRIIAAFNLDGIGAKNEADTRSGRKTCVTGYTKPEGERLCRLVGAANRFFNIGLEHRIERRENPGDDDGSFIQAGFPATVMVIGSWPYGDPNYHAEGDIPERSDVPTAAATVRAVLASVLTLDRERH